MATAKKLPSGSWRVRVCITGANGKQIRESFTAETKKEAELMAAEYMAGVKSRQRCALSLGEAIDEFIETCRVQDYSPSTIKEYSARRRSSYPSIIDMKVDKITSRDVQLAMNERAEEKTPKTVRNDFYLLKRVLGKYAPNLNLNNIILSRRKSRRKLEFTESMAFDILNYAREHMEPDIYLYCCFTVSAGLRPSETYALTWADVSAEPMTGIGKDGKPYRFGEISVSAASVRDENSNYVIKATKTAAGTRVVRVDWAFFENLYAMKSRGASDARIMSMNQDMMSHRWPKIREALQLPEEMRFYDLRHFYATQYASSGATEEELQKAMGHSTASFTHQVYVEIFRDREAAINAKMAEQTGKLYADLSEKQSAEFVSTFVSTDMSKSG